MILMYHKIDIHSPTMWWVDVASFYAQMMSLRDRRIVYLDEYDPRDAEQVVITFDGVYQNVLQFAAPLLHRMNYPFELFISSDFIGKDNKFDVGEPAARFADGADLLRLVEMGGRLQWHTRTHKRLNTLRSSHDWKGACHELAVPQEVSDLDRKGFRWFAYPYGEFSEDVREEVAKSFEGAVSCHQGSSYDQYAMNRLTVTNSTNFRRESVCVVVVSHNYGAFLAEAVESVLRQTYQPDEILLVDDASDDATPAICERYALLLPGKIRRLRNENRLGIVGTFNRAVSSTTSDVICFLGADNRFSTNYLEEVMGQFAKNEDDLGVVYTDFLLFGSRAHEEYLRHSEERRGRIRDDVFYEVTFPEFSRAAFLQGSFIHGSSAYRRKAFDAVGGYREELTGPEDSDLFRRMIRAGFSARKAKNTWLEYRQHSEDQANIVSRTRGELEFFRVYSRRLELKVRALEGAFGMLSPAIKALSSFETVAFRFTLSLVRSWRRLFR